MVTEHSCRGDVQKEGAVRRDPGWIRLTGTQPLLGRAHRSPTMR